MNPAPAVALDAIREFLTHHPPFNRMSDAALTFLVSRLTRAQFS